MSDYFYPSLASCLIQQTLRWLKREIFVKVNPALSWTRSLLTGGRVPCASWQNSQIFLLVVVAGSENTSFPGKFSFFSR